MRRWPGYRHNYRGDDVGHPISEAVVAELKRPVNRYGESTPCRDAVAATTDAVSTGPYPRCFSRFRSRECFRTLAGWRRSRGPGRRFVSLVVGRSDLVGDGAAGQSGVVQQSGTGLSGDVPGDPWQAKGQAFAQVALSVGRVA